jgi:ABC-2 type transport system permease protein
MTTTAPVLPRTGAGRLRWAVVDAWTITRRALSHWARQPTQVIAGLLFPVMLVLLFGYLFGGSMAVPGGGDYREYLMPGMFVMTMAFGIGETMVNVTTDADRGVTDRFRSMPMAPSAVVVGRSLADMLYSAAALAVMIGCGLVVGWRWHEGVGKAALAVGLLLLLRFSVLWVGIYLGLVVRSAGGAAAVQTLLFPLTMVTNTFAEPGTMPAWLGALAAWNPLSATVSATRELFGNPGWGGDAWIAQHAPAMAVVWPLLIVALFLPLAVRRYQRLSR